MERRSYWKEILILEKKEILRIEKCVHGGAGLLRLPDGMICFVEGALPGESVELESIERKKDFAKAGVLRVLEPHEKRQVPPCFYYGRCGGCNAQHANFELQIEILRGTIFDLFSRTAGKKIPENFEIHTGAQWNYRCRAQLFKTDNERTPWGFRARGSNDTVAIEKCMILSEKLNEKLSEYSPEKKRRIFDNQSEKFLGKHIHADETVFFQSNLELLPSLINAVKEAAGTGAVLLDVFCGVGLFSAILRSKFEKVIAIEEDLNCQKFAEKNLGENCEFHAKSAEEFFAENTLDLSKACVIIDPPRLGLSKNLCYVLCKAKIQKLIYVSCDPATLARDTAKFLKAGYELKNIQGFAFYPQTFHLEMMAEFSFFG